MNLNARAAALCELIVSDAARLRVTVETLPCGAKIIDCGVDAPGGLAAGQFLARACLADLGDVAVMASGQPTRPTVVVQTDHPRLACMAAQYAGWEVQGDDYFAMGSGPMRAAAAREPLFEDLQYRESAEQCVGVLETDKIPPEAVCLDLAAKCGVAPSALTLLTAPTRSLAGGVQVVARSVETAMHKLHELQFDLTRVEAGWGSAPFPPPAADDLAAIGRTNDAILYGGQVVLYVHGDDDSIEQIGPQIPASASRDYGRPFAQVLSHYNHDFYQVDPLLFSPARVTLANVETGHAHSFGQLNEQVLRESFGEREAGQQGN